MSKSHQFDPPNLGATPNTVSRDAVHIAVVPQVATKAMKPGERVEIGGKYVGVVDPFRTDEVWYGQRYWLLLEPGSISGLRHQWEHDAFDSEGSAEKSKEWLRSNICSYGVSLEYLIEALEDGDGVCFGYDDYPDLTDEVWRHVEIATGKVFGEKHRENTYFRCAC